MEAKNILQADLLDILFEGRNKTYGAYELRKTYSTRVYKALGAMGAISLLFFAGILFANSKKVKPILEVSGDVFLESVANPPKNIITPPPVKLKPPQVKVVKFMTPVIAKNNEIVDPPPPVDVLLGSNIGTENINGKDLLVTNAPIEKIGTGANSIGVEIKEPPFISVQLEAQFPGGADAWRRFLEHNLRSDLPVENGAPAGTYRVIVSFTVDENGNVSDIRAENDPGYGTADEAIRVIKKSNLWIPAEQNGKKVTYRQRQSITFLVDENG